MYYNKTNIDSGLTKIIPTLRKIMYIDGIHRVTEAYSDGNDIYWIEVNNPVSDFSVAQPIRTIEVVSPGLPADEFPQPERVSPLMVRPIPNAHLDKVLLTKEQLLDVLAWAIEQSTGETFPHSHLPVDHVPSTFVKGDPESAAEKLAAFLATITYGPNNYIGPGKTGLLNADLETIVTTVPALSDADAAARAHDIALSVTNEPVVDNILPPLARAAQIARPLFHGYQDTNSRRVASRTKYSHTSSSQLSKDGDVEQNPGPIYYLTDGTAVDEVTKLCSDPTSYTTYLSDISQNARIDEYAFYSSLGTYAMRGGLDNQSDYIMHDTYLTNYVSYDFSDVVPTSVTIPEPQLISYIIQNDNVKALLSDAPLGLAMAASLNNIDTFTGMQRTNNNTISGDALLGMYARSSKSDFGCYLPIAKLLAYEATKAPLSGSRAEGYKNDAMTRADPVVNRPPMSWVYPNTVGWAPAALDVIECYYMTPATAAGVLRGQIEMPFGWSVDANDVAFVILNPNLEPSAVTYLTMCHLEYPFYSYVDTTVQKAYFAGGGNVPNVIGGSARPYLNGHLIQGPRTKVMLVCTAEPPGIALDSNNTTIDIQEWTGALPAPPASNIKPTLIDFVDSNIGGTPNTQTPAYTEVLQYLLSFADITDWKVALNIAAGLTHTVKTPICYIAANAANSAPVVTNGTVPPTVDGQVAVRNLAAVTIANKNTLVFSHLGLHPVICASGVASAYAPTNGVPVVGGGPAPREAGSNTCSLQDSTWVTKFGISVKFWKKDVLSQADVTKLTKARVRNIWYAMKKISLINYQMFHNWFQDRGITNRMIWSNLAQVADRRVDMWRRFYSDFKKYQISLFGYQAYKPMLPPAKRVSPALIPALIGYYDEDSYLDSPVYLFNHFLNANEPKPYYGAQPDVNYTLAQACGWISARPLPLPNQPVFGLLTGGANCIIVPDRECTDKGRWKQIYRNAYALAKCVAFINPAPITGLINVWVVAEGGAAPAYVRSPLYNNYAFLRWTSTQADSSLYRNNARGILYWLPPFFPPEYDNVRGINNLLGADSQVGAYGIRNAYNFTGIGSANFGMVATNIGLDVDLQIDDNPF